MRMAKDSPTSAIAKVVAVADALGQGHRRVTDIAAAARLPPSTVHRILRELVRYGWVEVGDDHVYDFGPGLLALVEAVGEDAAAARLVRVARPILRVLRARTRHTVHLAVRHGDQAIYVDKLDGLGVYQMRSRIGLSIPLHSTAIGKAILASLPEEQVRLIAARTGLPALTEHTITSLPALLTHLAEVRRRRFAVDNEENEDHIRCIGAVVVDRERRPIGAVSLTALAFDLTPEQIDQLAPLVIGAATQISAALGAPGWSSGPQVPSP